MRHLCHASLASVYLAVCLLGCAAPAPVAVPPDLGETPVPTSIGEAIASESPESPQDDTPIKVVATHSILGDLVANVGGNAISLTTLVGPDGDAHTFEPRPVDSIALAEARLVFENGFGFEGWLDKLFAASGSKAVRIAVTEGIAPAKVAEDDSAAGGAAEGAADGIDPHVWHDVQNAMRMVAAIRNSLSDADPARRAFYQANAEDYLARLRELDEDVVSEVDRLPPNRRTLVTSHDTFGYFAKRYGFTVLGSGLGAASTEVAEPSASQMAALIDAIKAAKVPAIFAENVQNPALIKQIAEDAGVKLGPPLYTDALGLPGTAGDTYEKMMRYNVAAIVDALR